MHAGTGAATLGGMSARFRPLGRLTRGKTAHNRLRRIDTYVALAHADALKRPHGLVVDVGYGAHPWTTVEMARRWRPLNPTLRFLGIEIDPERVAAAAPHAEPPALDFRLGGFNLVEVLGAEKAQVIRCYNVLRQYSEDEVAEALAQMSLALEPGGLLVEGTCDPLGRMVAFDVYRNSEAGLVHQSVVFGTSFRQPVEPTEFRTIAPKRLIHRMFDDAPARFFGDWERSYHRARGRGCTAPRTRWAVAARALRSEFGHPVDTRERLLRRGYLALAGSLSA